MNKKLILFLLLALLLPATATAYDFEVDGIYYNINGNEATVTSSENASYGYGYSGSVTIPATVTYGGKTYSVTAIGDYAFYWCYSLDSLSIPYSVTAIGDAIFSECYISTIQVDNNNPKYDSRDNCNAIIETATNTIIVGCRNTTIPSSVTSIGYRAFAGCYALFEFYLGSSITHIGDGAFAGCWNLLKIGIPNSVTHIGNGAFSSCNSLFYISIGSSVTYIGEHAFSGISESGVEIYCWALTPPTMGNSNCFSSYTYSDAVLKVPRNSIEAYRTTEYWSLFENITSIEGPIGYFEENGILYYAESEGTARVVQNKDVENYYTGDVVIPDNVVHDGVTYWVTSISNNAFEDCYELTSIVIPNTVENIGEQAFQGCTGLKSVTIGSGVTTIGSKAFNYCNTLETVKCIGTVPPVMASSDCFSTAAYNHAQLLVPRQSIENYQAADYWYKFAHIEGWGSAGMGDVDGDGYVTINDATNMIDVMLGGGSEDFYFESSDFNNNGRVDIADVVTLIDYLLNGYY